MKTELVQIVQEAREIALRNEKAKAYSDSVRSKSEIKDSTVTTICVSMVMLTIGAMIGSFC